MESTQLPNKSIVRSVNIANDGKIYTGGHAEFGFWKRNNLGKLKYTSLSKNLKNQDILKNDEIWKIIFFQDNIIFHSFSKSYLYKNDEVKTLTAEGEPFLFAHQVENRLYYEQIPSGLHEFSNGELTVLRNKGILINKNVFSILKYDETKNIIATANDGLYFIDVNNNITKWTCEATDVLSKYQVNNGIKISNDYYAYGTIKNGLYIVDRKGKIIQHINKNNGLQNNTVLSIEKDLNNNLWVGLDNGIDFIQINSPLYYYTDFKGEIGTVYTSSIYKNKLYLGTNQGLYVSDWPSNSSNKNFAFKLIPHSNGHVWKLKIINNQLLCGHNNGTYLVQENQIKKISNITGGYFYISTVDGKHILQGNYTGLSLFNINTNITYIKQFTHIKEPLKYAVHNGSNQYWIGNQDRFHLVEFNPNKKDVQFQYNTTHDSSLAKIKFNGVSFLENRIVFSSDSGLYFYDEVLKKFVYYTDLNKRLNTYKNSNQILKKSTNQYWFTKNASIAIVKFEKNGIIKIDSSSLHDLQNKMMKNHENVLDIGNNQHLIGLDYGFAIYTENIKNPEEAPFPPIISSIIDLKNTADLATEESINIPYQDNNVRIAFSSPLSNSNIQYQYLLEGYSKDWSPVQHETYKDFSNLPYGKYTFKVRAINTNGNTSLETILPLEVTTPWYYNWWMLLLCLIATSILFYISIKKYREKISHKQWLLNKRIVEKQREEIAKNAEINEKEIIRLKNFQLEKELEIKNRELSNATTNIVYKNEMLNKLNLELNKLNDSKGIALNEAQLNRLNKLIESIQNDNRDWDIFEKSFNDAHENFFKKLKLEYPELVPNDLKLCAYLRLNMSSKEIASLLNISTRGVEIRRYRLRKKLGISTDKNLTEFLLER